MKNKKICTGALALTITFGAVTTIQQGTLQTYAEENKDATVQEFLDYINTLKQKYPNFKFKESKIVCQPDEVDKVITEQKKQIEQSIKEYEEALKKQEADYNTQTAPIQEQNKEIEKQNKAKQDEYNQKKAQYDADVANYEKAKTDFDTWYNSQPTKLDIGDAKLVGDFDESGKNSLNFYSRLTAVYNKDKLAKSHTELTDEDIKFVQGKSTITNIQTDAETTEVTGQADSDGRPYVKRFDLNTGASSGTKATFDLHNIGTTVSGKTISAHVRYVLDTTTDVSSQFGVVPNKFLAMYFYEHRNQVQKGHFEVEFFDEATGEPMNLINVFVSSDIDGVTEKNYVESNGKIDGMIPKLSGVPDSDKYPELSYSSATGIVYSGKVDSFDIDREKSTPYGQGLTMTSGSKLTLGFGVGADQYGAFSEFSLPKIGAKSKQIPEKPVEPEKPQLTPLVDMPEKPAPVPYKGNTGIENTIEYKLPTIKYPLVKQYTTRYVDENLKDIAEKSITTDDYDKQKEIEGYHFIKTEDISEVRTYFYHQMTTSWVEDGTNKELKHEDKLVKEPGDITSYTYVRTETKENGDLVHIYKKIEQKKKDDVPTGVNNNILASVLALLAGVGGLVFLKKRKSKVE